MGPEGRAASRREGPVIMAKKRAAPPRPAADKGADPRHIVISVKGSLEFRDWLMELAAFCRLRGVEVIDHALVHYARHVGFPKPAPPRYTKR